VTNGWTELRWLRRAKAVAAFACKKYDNSHISTGWASKNEATFLNSFVEHWLSIIIFGTQHCKKT